MGHAIPLIAPAGVQRIGLCLWIIELRHYLLLEPGPQVSQANLDVPLAQVSVILANMSHIIILWMGYYGSRHLKSVQRWRLMPTTVRTALLLE